MRYKKILVTGGAGFVGSNLCLKLKNYYGKNVEIVALDNLIRKGSELNIPRLTNQEIIFKKADVRKKEDLNFNNIDLIIECSAEPSVMAGVNSSPEYLLDTNLLGAINCFELARKTKADVIFLSTSRVYPVKNINSLKFEEAATRFVLSPDQNLLGASEEGINEQFSLEGVRSLYGTTKLSAEIILQEYVENYGIRGVINRCGLIAGPWQMGKIDQGIIAFWMAHHVFKKPLKYIGFGGKGKQVRDVIHVDDLFDLINIQISKIESFNAGIYNVGGGRDSAISLFELTDYCQKLSGNKILIEEEIDNRQGDIRIYITDNRKITKKSKWKPNRNIEQILNDTYLWIESNKDSLISILN